MPKTTQRTTCHDAFKTAQSERAKYPLRSGEYKLREVHTRLSRAKESMDKIGEHLKKPGGYELGQNLGPCCTTDDKAIWLKAIPMWVAEMLGYDILPAIKALTGDGIADRHVAAELASGLANARNLLQDCQSQHNRLERGLNGEFRRMKTGYSDVYGLLVGAEDIAAQALWMIDWARKRAQRMESNTIANA